MIKRGILYIFSILILFGLILNFVYGVDNTSSSSVTVSGDGYGVSNATRGGALAIVNFTLIFGTLSNNVTNITITIPNNVTIEDLGSSANASLNVNSTSGANWDCHASVLNLTNEEVWFEFLECSNSTSPGDDDGNEISISFNYTGNSSIETTIDWGIEISNESNIIENLTLSTNLDGLSPRLLELNVSDGYTALVNGSSGQFSIMPYSVLSSDVGAVTYNGTNGNGTLSGAHDLKVQVTFEDFYGASTMSSGNNVYLYYLTNDTNITDVTYTGADNGGVNVVRMTTSDSLPKYMFEADLTGLIEQNITTFVLIANDTLNNILYWNQSESPFAVLINSSRQPSISFGSISDGLYTVTTTTGGYLRSGTTHTFNISVNGQDFFFTGDEILNITRDPMTDGVNLYYNVTENNENLTVGVNGYSTYFGDGPVVFTNTSTYSENAADFNGTIFVATGNNTEVVYWAITANNTNGTYYTLLTGSYGIDDSIPTSTSITSSDADNRISVGSSITFTCSANDVGIGVNANAYAWSVSAGGVYDTVSDQKDSTLTLSSGSSDVDTNSAGDYTVKCIPYDSLGHEGDAATLSYVISSTTGGTSSGGSGGGSSTSTTISFDADLSTTSTSSVSGGEGRIRSFSFDGTTKHTLTFKSVMSDSVTLEIASTPIEVTLMVGESKMVDLNADGINDLKVTLDNVKPGATAVVNIEKLEEGAKKVVEEEKTQPTEQQPAAPTGGEVPVQKSTGWLWTTLLVIVILVIVGYYAFKKKK